MSKPEWNEDTPYWAEWLAMDNEGQWWWFEYEPERMCSEWFVSQTFGRKSKAYPSWKKTLERRP